MSSDITALIESNRYNVEILPQLETYVQTQVDNKTYNFEANSTILKFYQFHPEKTNKMIVGKILSKALMNLPSIDFSLCMYLIPEKLHSEEPIKILVSLQQLLESARFTEFWTESNTCRELLNTVPGFDDAIRSFISGLLNQTYHSISKEILSSSLNLTGNELDSLISSKGWKQADDFVTFSKTDEPQPLKNQKRTEHSKVEELPRILQSLRY